MNGTARPVRLITNPASRQRTAEAAATWAVRVLATLVILAAAGLAVAADYLVPVSWSAGDLTRTVSFAPAPDGYSGTVCLRSPVFEAGAVCCSPHSGYCGSVAVVTEMRTSDRMPVIHAYEAGQDHQFSDFHPTLILRPPSHPV